MYIRVINIKGTTQHNTRKKITQVLSEFYNSNCNNVVRNMKSKELQCSGKQNWNKLTCMHKEFELTFNLMFVKASNAVILTKKKLSSFDRFVQFRFWDKGERERWREREREREREVKTVKL